MIARGLVVVLVLAGAATACRPAHRVHEITGPTALPRTGVAAGTLVLAGGGEVAYRYEFDHDDLAAAVVSDGALIAATGSGHLLRFDGATLAFEREQLVAPPVTALAAIPGTGLVAGLADGTVVAVDPITLAITRIGAVLGQPTWLGADDRRLIVVAGFGWDRMVYRLWLADPTRADPPIAVPRDDGPGAASAWLIERGRLWFGADVGEWGGWTGSIDLATGVATPVAHLPDGVYGLIAHGGAVWAYGGTSHMGYTHSSITELRDQLPPNPWPVEPDPGVPHLPIADMTAIGDTLRVVLWNQLYEVDGGLKRWTKLAEIPARYRWGRPDAVGAYPAITEVLAVGDDLVLATRRDGVFRVRAGAVEPHAIGDPLDGGLARVAPAGDAVVALGTGLYRRTGDGWVAAPFPDQPDDTYALMPIGDHVLVERADGSTATARWTGDHYAVIGQQADGPDAARVIALGAARWGFRHGDLWRFDAAAARWTVAGHYDDREGRGLDLGYDLRAIGDDLVLDADHHALYRLRARDRQPAVLVRLLRDHDVDDGVAGPDGVLLSLDGKLATLAADGHATRTALAAPAAPITHLTRDRDGHLWYATGDGLFVLGDHLAAIELPVLTGRAVTSLTADPAGGVVALVGGASLHLALAPG